MIDLLKYQKTFINRLQCQFKIGSDEVTANKMQDRLDVINNKKLLKLYFYDLIIFYIKMFRLK